MSVSRREFIKSVIAGSAALSVPSVGLAGAGAKAGLNLGRELGPGEQIQRMYDWHCDNFFDFNKHLPTRELEYIRQSYLVMDSWDQDMTDDFSYSVASFSHRIQGENVNSSRLYAGSFVHYSKLEPQIIEIIKHRGLSPDKLPIAQQAEGYRPLLGLGWNVEEDDFKVYGYVDDLTKTPDGDILDLFRSSADLDAHPFGLVSYTFKGNRISEKKVYVGARNPTAMKGLELATADIEHVNYMITSERGRIPQVDLKEGFSYSKLQNDRAREICSLYEEYDHEETLDTLAYHGPDAIDLYFP